MEPRASATPEPRGDEGAAGHVPEQAVETSSTLKGDGNRKRSRDAEDKSDAESKSGRTRRLERSTEAVLKRLRQDSEGANRKLQFHETAVDSAEARVEALARDRWAQYLAAFAADRELDNAEAVLALARARLLSVQRRIELGHLIRANNFRTFKPLIPNDTGRVESSP